MYMWFATVGFVPLKMKVFKVFPLCVISETASFQRINDLPLRYMLLLVLTMIGEMLCMLYPI